MALKSIEKMKALLEAAGLEISVTKEGGPIVSAVEVGSTGDDDARFRDARLTPGPASMPLEPGNTYALVWTVAFVRRGTAILTAKVTTASGKVHKVKTKKVEGAAGETVMRVILIPGGLQS